MPKYNLKKVLNQNIFSFQCPDHLIKKIDAYYKLINWDKVAKRNNKKSKFENGRSYIPEGNSLTKIEELDSLHTWFKIAANSVRESVGWDKEFIKKIKISQSWLNYSKKGEVHHLHSHGLSLLSGILYLTEPSSTQFFIPSIYSLPSCIASKSDSEILIKEHYEGKKGELIIFPSKLDHWVGPNMSMNKRITLSFNTWFEGEAGIAKNLCYIP